MTGDTLTRAVYSLLMPRSVKNTRPRGTTAISSKHQVTIPVAALRDAGLRPGDRLRAHADGPGRVVLEREEDPFDKYLGSFTGLYDGFDLDALRDEWA
jgi:bifunctional DNA-binding transcriptional regulator/antitoxin component of YhaV-PrlF toxin-antitoxin module